MDRTRPAWIILPREIRAAHTAIAERTELHVLKVKGALKGIQLEPSAPEFDEHHARLGESQSLNPVHLRKMLQAVVMLVNSRERETEMGS